MYDQKQKSLNDIRLKRKMLNRWENEGGATVSGEPYNLAGDKRIKQLNGTKGRTKRA